MRRSICVSFGLAAILLAPIAASNAQVQQASEAEQVDTYLDGLGLDHLRLVHLEQAVEADSGANGLAKTLADLYANRLLTVEAPAEVGAISAKIDALVEKHPEANTPALRVMRLQADAGRAEVLASKWVADPADDASKTAALAILERIAPDLDAQQAALFKAIEAEQKSIDNLEDGEVRDRREEALARLANVAGRALYYDAWSNYYLDLLADDDPNHARTRHARDAFRKLLGVESTEDLEPSMLAAGGMARAGLGAALASSRMDDPKAATDWFDLLRSEGVHPEVRDLADYWAGWTDFRAGRANAVAERVRKLGDQFGASPTPGQDALATLLVREGFANGAADVDRLGAAGLLALARMDRAGQVRELAEKLGLKLGAGPVVDFVLRWAEGRERLDAATRSKSPADYRAAAESFRAAIGSEAVDQAPAVVAACRYRLAWSLYGMGDLAGAAGTFGQAASALKSTDPSQAADASWMQAVALERRAGSNPAQVAPAVAVLEAFGREYPNHPNAKLVPLEVRKLRGGAITADAIAATPPSDPNFPAIALAALRHHASTYRRAVQAGDKSAQDSERSRFDEVLAALQKLPSGRTTAEARLEALLLESGVENASHPNAARAAQLLDRAEPLADALPTGDKLAIDYHRARLDLARSRADSEAVGAESRWIAEHADGNAALGAFVTLARIADQSVQDAEPATRPRKLAEARDAYARLSESLGQDSEAVAAGGNALVALSRLAAYESQLNHPAAAATHYDAILDAFPNDANYLRKAAIAHDDADQPARALECWGTLVAGLPSGSESWFEAKVGQLAALAETDPASARAALDQLKLLYPDLGGERWKTQLGQIQDRIPNR